MAPDAECETSELRVRKLKVWRMQIDNGMIEIEGENLDEKERMLIFRLVGTELKSFAKEFKKDGIEASIKKIAETIEEIELMEKKEKAEEWEKRCKALEERVQLERKLEMQRQNIINSR